MPTPVEHNHVCPYHDLQIGAQANAEVDYLRQLIQHADFVCVFGKAALQRSSISFHTLESGLDDEQAAGLICEILYSFIQQLHQLDLGQRRLPLFSCVVMFPTQHFRDEQHAIESVTKLMLTMHAYDRQQGHTWAPYVSDDPKSNDFSFSIGGEAFFMPLLYEHAHSAPRRSRVTALVFNWHALFDELRKRKLYTSGRDNIRERTRKRGFVVPQLLTDHGKGEEYPQYVLPSPENELFLWQCLLALGGEAPFSK